MARETAYYDDQSKGGGGYKVTRSKSRNPDQEALENLAVGFGGPLAGAGLVAAASRRSKDTDDTEKDPRDAVRGQKGYSGGGSVSSASRRADGIAKRGKTRGKFV